MGLRNPGLLEELWGDWRSLTQRQDVAMGAESQLQVSGLEGTCLFAQAWRCPGDAPGTLGRAKFGADSTPSKNSIF